MAKRCPEQNNRPVIYLDCAECEKRKECREKSRKEHKEKSHKELNNQQ